MKLTPRTVAGIALLLLSAGCRKPAPDAAAALEGVPLPPDRTLDQVLAGYDQAIGGTEKLAAIQSVRLTGTMSGTRVTGATLTVEKKRPGFFRRELHLPKIEQPRVEGVDGTTVWKVDPLIEGTGPTAITGSAAQRFYRMADLDGPLVGYQAEGSKIELASKEKLEGKDVYRLKLTPTDGRPLEIYLDAATFLPIRTRGIEDTGAEPFEVRTTFDDYRDVDGVKWPFSEKTELVGQSFEQTIHWTTIEVNVPLDDSRFKMP